MLKPFSGCFVEISGACNARCPWCERGGRACGTLSPLPPSSESPFITPHLFAQTLRRLLDLNFIVPNAVVRLYNWGEPLMHPNIIDILAIIKNLGLKCWLSTNGSRFVNFRKPGLINVFRRKALPHVARLSISMPGFSQDSYDRAHGFSFQKTLDTIKKLVMEAKRSGLNENQIALSGHIYRHNQREIPMMRAFAEGLNIKCNAIVAFLASPNLFKGYLEGSLAPDILEKAKQDLFLPDPKTMLELRPINYVCPQYDMLILSHTGKISLCCFANLNINTDEYELLDPMSREVCEGGLMYVDTIRRNHIACHKCKSLGADWFIHGGYSFPNAYIEPRPSL